jgi:hypothetical protein
LNGPEPRACIGQFFLSLFSRFHRYSRLAHNAISLSPIKIDQIQ